jgi:hypothetical protein
MIARYFGGKVGLYLESLRRDEPPPADGARDSSESDELRALLKRVNARGPTPPLYAAVRPHDDAELQAAAVAALQRWLVAPFRRLMEQCEQDLADLRAEIVTATLAGVVLSRRSGALPTLSGASSADVARLLSAMAAALLNPSTTIEP